MSLLGHVTTELGPVELHHTDGRFTTRRVVETRRTPFFRKDSIVSTIVISREGAREWYELCARRGVVFRAFPEAEKVSA